MNGKEFVRSKTPFKHLGIFDRANIANGMEQFHKHKMETAWTETKEELPCNGDKILFVVEEEVYCGFLDMDEYSNEERDFKNPDYGLFIDRTSWHDAYGFRDTYEIEKVSHWQLEPKPIKK